MTIDLEDDTIVLRIKHFDPGLRGWEEKDHATEFVLVQVAPRQAIFLQRHKPNPPWLIYQRTSDDQLIAYFERVNEAAQVEGQFIYQRQP